MRFHAHSTQYIYYYLILEVGYHYVSHSMDKAQAASASWVAGIAEVPPWLPWSF
jgi:hypothetical protein